jgi:hypothetical protein
MWFDDHWRHTSIPFFGENGLFPIYIRNCVDQHIDLTG